MEKLIKENIPLERNTPSFPLPWGKNQRVPRIKGIQVQFL